MATPKKVVGGFDDAKGGGDGQGFGFRGYPVFFGHTGTLGGDQVGKARCELRRVVRGGCERKELEAAGDGVSRW